MSHRAATGTPAAPGRVDEQLAAQPTVRVDNGGNGGGCDDNKNEMLCWIEDRFPQFLEAFRAHGITAKHAPLLGLAELRDMGIMALGDRLDIVDSLREFESVVDLQIQVIEKKKPMSWFRAFLMVISFKWVQRLNCKTIDDAKAEREQLVTKHSSIAIVSSLLDATALDWFASAASSCYCHESVCYCGAGFDLDFIPLQVFFFFLGFSCVFNFFSTVLAVLQIMMVYEVPDDRLGRFLAEMGHYTLLPNIFFLLGFATFAAGWTVFVLFNSYLGLVANSTNVFPWLTMCAWIPVFVSFALLAQFIRVLYMVLDD